MKCLVLLIFCVLVAVCTAATIQPTYSPGQGDVPDPDYMGPCGASCMRRHGHRGHRMHHGAYEDRRLGSDSNRCPYYDMSLDEKISFLEESLDYLPPDSYRYARHTRMLEELMNSDN
ncbi:hypothetical protein LSH36_1002g02004 [Paralvinella palmiformis]|uniref:Secreted protein n=1 Tax=Paralvinella palmiformis TaxID=53620 RepID=A0AAD9IW19_9ANNE|nr:hypothetical protein LSH36_1002g02004 [Paralvinella palmiformis]